MLKYDLFKFQINGLFLQGADFDGKRLVDITGNKSELVGLPITNLYFISNKNRNDTNTIEVPVYENIFREHYICKLKFSIAGELDDTILKGIAICLDSL